MADPEQPAGHVLCYVGGMLNVQTLQMALIGYETERQKIEQRIAEIRQRLGGRKIHVAASATVDGPARKGRRMSPAARKRIAAAQKARWAAYHNEKAKPAARKA